MGIASPPRINIPLLMNQVTEISQNLGVEFTPYSRTSRGLVYARFDPNNPLAQKPLDVLIQTREGIPRESFLTRFPFDVATDSSHAFAVEWRAMQYIVDGAGGEAKLLADIAQGDDVRRRAAASRMQSSLALPVPGVSAVSGEDALIGYRSAFVANVRSAMLFSLLLGESHVEVANRFFQTAVNSMQMGFPSAAAMFAEVAADRITGVDPFSPDAQRIRWYRSFAAKAWRRSIVASDPREVKRFKIDGGIFNSWSDENPMLAIELHMSSDELNARQRLYAEATSDMLRATRLMLERGVKAIGGIKAVDVAACCMNKAVKSAAKVPGMKRESVEMLRELHRWMIGEAP